MDFSESDPLDPSAGVPEQGETPPSAVRGPAFAPPEPPVTGDAGAADEAGTTTVGRPVGKRRQGLEWVVLVVCSLAVALLVRAFLIQAFYIPSESMLPTLHKDDRVLVNKLSYKLHDVNRGDVIVFEAPPGAGTSEVKDLIKRVIGLPGETIEGRAGAIYIDDKPLDEDYLPDDVRSREFPPEKVPEHSYWVLGDNRQDSRDSTFFKSIKEDSIIGRAFIRIWPPKAFGLL